MFESDDFDQVLSQFDYPDVPTVKIKKKENTNISNGNVKNLKTKILTDGIPNQTNTPHCTEYEVAELPCSNSSDKSVILVNKHSKKCSENIENVSNNRDENIKQNTESDPFLQPKHNKRKIINSYFNHHSKRKFPGPAGLLTGTLEVSKDESICQMEVLSQDIDYTQHNARRDLFESPMWIRLLNDVQSWNSDIDSINSIKQQALSGNLRRRKAQNVTAFVEAVDRSAIDPLIILRDATGSIKCTLHRDAWSSFSQYILSDCCAVILQKPTVLTTGGAFKKHYLNITLSNILAIYSSTVLSDDGNKTLPDGYSSIKCTLHRDAWSSFSQYILSDCCAVILQKPTVLTTGGAFKKHYLNITLSNILAIYSSTVLSDDGNKTLPDGYSFVYEDEYTVIKTEKCSDSLGTSLEHSNGTEEFIDGLDSFFSDDLF